MILSDLTLILVCLIGAAFFAGMETGVISLNRMRLRHLAEKGDRAARILQNFIEQPDRFLGTTLVGSNLCIVVASVIAAGRGSLLGPWGEAAAGVIMTVVVLVVAEYIPKAWFQSRPMKRCRPFAAALRWSYLVLRPLVTLANRLTDFIIPGSVAGSASRALVSTKDEIDVLAQESAEHGTLSPRQRLMIRRVLELSSKTARDIMTPAAAMAVIPTQATIADLMSAVRHSAHTRFPVRDSDGTSYRGTVNFFDVMAGTETASAPDIIETFVRPPLFMPDNTPLMEMFAKLRLSRQSMCLVVDSRSAVVGLVTNQNILQAIVGAV